MQLLKLTKHYFQKLIKGINIGYFLTTIKTKEDIMYPVNHPYYINRKSKSSNQKEKVKKFIEVTQEEIDLIIKITEFSQLEVSRHFKKFGDSDYDLKEIFWYYRYNTNLLRKRFIKLRGY